MRVTAYVGLGANLGDREATLRRAVELLDEEPGIDVVAVSSFRETDPVGYTDQPRFLNAAVALATDLPPRVLLDGSSRSSRCSAASERAFLATARGCATSISSSTAARPSTSPTSSCRTRVWQNGASRSSHSSSWIRSCSSPTGVAWRTCWRRRIRRGVRRRRGRVGDPPLREPREAMRPAGGVDDPPLSEP